MRKESETKNGLKFVLLKRYYKIIILFFIVCAIVIGIVVGYNKYKISESKTTKIGFENIGELATQAAYCTEVSVTEDGKQLFGMRIPFTQSKYIYSYDTVVKAGIDFGEVEWEVAEKKIEIKIPEVKILSNEIDMDSFKVYHEDESIFNQITLTETNDSLKELTRKAEEDAVENGILENARSNAETILTGFFSNVEEFKDYEIIFKNK